MSDSERLDSIERQLSEVQSRLTQLSLTVAQLSRGSNRTRETTQAAVDDLKEAIDLIFKNVHVPNVVYSPGHRNIIE